MRLRLISRLISRLAIPLLLAAAAAAACSDSNGPAQPAPETPTPAPILEPAQIPTESLPDPLPEPYFFRAQEAAIPEPEIVEQDYIVQSGDTLERIARAYCTTPSRIQRLNAIVDPTLLRIGDRIRVPISNQECSILNVTREDTGEDAVRSSGDGQVLRTYTVQPGDTLFEIGLAFGLTWQSLQEFNNLSDDEAAQLTVGQRLWIPAPEPPPEEPADDPEAEADSQDANGADAADAQAADEEEQADDAP